MNTIEDVSAAQLLKDASPEEYDVVILGGGTGSTIAAWTFAGQGQRVAVIDRKYIGGSCPNIACLPSKNIIHSAKVASYVRRSEEFIAKDGFRVDMPTVRGRKRGDGIGLERYVSRHLKEERRGIHPRLRTLRRPPDLGGLTS
jgi:pyruvate/2-oxoglutarate dehydrogenase complex dihydrolipoamide dehydrogenase (E3) component